MLIESLLTAAMLGFAPEASVGGILRAIRMVAPQFGMVHKEKRPERNFLPSEQSDRRTLKSARLTITLEDGQEKSVGSQIALHVVSEVNGSTLQIASVEELGKGERWLEAGRSFYTYELKFSDQIAFEQVKAGALMTKFNWVPLGNDELRFSYRLVLEFARDDNDAPEIIEQASTVPISLDSKSLSFTGF